MSRTRRVYMLRLIGRCLILIFCGLLCVFASEQFEIIEEGKFFERLSWLHLLWICWVIDMIRQLVPVKHDALALGSQKLFRQRFRPAKEYDRAVLRQYIRAASKRACGIFLLWGALTAGLSLLYVKGLVTEKTLFMISVIFYVCDLICVLIWCPFRLFLKNRCCTTCRIFNWDHLMMFTPMAAINSFYARSLLVLSILVWGAWELSILVYPERFWASSNTALQCGNCTDKLCTQYCQKDKAFTW